MIKSPLLLINYWLVAVLSFSQTFSEADVARITADNRFNVTRNMAGELIEHYPPENHVVIGLGRTTGMTGMWADELAGADDYFRFTPVQNLSEIREMTPQQQEAFWSRIFPSREELGDRRLVVHRVIWTGNTMHEASESMYRFLRTRGYPLPIDFDYAGIDLEDVRPDPRNWFRARLNRMNSTDYFEYLEDIDRDNSHFPGRRFTDVGEVDPLTPRDIVRGQTFTPNSNAELFRGAIEAGGCEEALSFF